MAVTTERGDSDVSENELERRRLALERCYRNLRHLAFTDSEIVNIRTAIRAAGMELTVR